MSPQDHCLNLSLRLRTVAHPGAHRSVLYLWYSLHSCSSPLCRDAGGSDRRLMRPERQATRIRASSLVNRLAANSPLPVLKIETAAPARFGLRSARTQKFADSGPRICEVSHDSSLVTLN